MSDEATRWFLEDARAQGLSIREYEARYGIMLMPAQRKVLGHETPFSDLGPSWADGGHEKAPAITATAPTQSSDAPFRHRPTLHPGSRGGGGEELREAA